MLNFNKFKFHALNVKLSINITRLYHAFLILNNTNLNKSIFMSNYFETLKIIQKHISLNEKKSL